MTEHTYMVIDTETSGLFDFQKPADADGQPRLASLAMVLLAPDMSIASEQNFLVKPDGWTMNAEATAIHGLTQDRLMEEGQLIDDVLVQYALALEARHVIVGYNVSFDLKMMRGEMRRLSMPDRYEDTASICCMRPLTDVCKITKPTGRGYKFPKLTEAYKFLFGRDYEGAHGSLQDARACAEIFREIRARDIRCPLAIGGAA